jgi:hypothetical protein
MTNLLLERLLRYACFTFLAVMLVLVVTACGPGGGGTGTGPLMSFTSASASSGVPPPTTPSGSGDGNGISACGRFDLRLEEGRVDLVASCGSFVFVGGWAADPSQRVVLPGVLKLSGAVEGVPATLLLQFSGEPEISQIVTATLVDETGRTLAGPGVLGRVE